MIKVKYLEYTEVDTVVLHCGGQVISAGSDSWLDVISSDITKLEIHEFDNGTLYIRATTKGGNGVDEGPWNVHRYASYRGDYTVVYLEEDILG